MPEEAHSKSNRWLTVLTVDPQKTDVNRNQIIEALETEDIEARPVWKPMHMQPLYKGCEFVRSGKKDISKSLFEQGLCLPSGSNLIKKHQNKVIEVINSVLTL